MSQSAMAQDGVVLQNLQSASLTRLQTGQQLLVNGHDGPFTFAGRQFQASAFTGVAGYSSEVAYVAVISGKVTLGDAIARAGRMLLLPPLGGTPIVERFDAERFAESWPQPARTAEAQSYARLLALADAQRSGIRLGRLGRTGLNVAAPGSADREIAARTVKGSDTIRAIRFSATSSPEQVEQSIAQSFIDALAARDADGVASLLDPVPYGTTDLRHGAAEARHAFAEALLAQKDWPGLLAGASLTRSDGEADWLIEGPVATGVVRLRPMGDFAFVRAIELGAR